MEKLVEPRSCMEECLCKPCCCRRSTISREHGRYVSLECPGDPTYEKGADAARGNATTAEPMMSTCRCMNDVSGVRGNSDAVVMIDDESSGTIPWQSHAVQRKTVVTKIFVVRPCPTYMFSTCRRCTCTCESTILYTNSVGNVSLYIGRAMPDHLVLMTFCINPTLPDRHSTSCPSASIHKAARSYTIGC